MGLVDYALEILQVLSLIDQMEGVIVGREMTLKPKYYHSCFVGAVLHRAPVGVFACVLDGMIEQIKLQSLKNPWYHLVVVAVTIAGIGSKRKVFCRAEILQFSQDHMLAH